MSAVIARPLREPFARRTWAEIGYVLATLPLATVGFAYLLVSLFLGVVLAVTFIGLPLLAVTGLGARGLGSVQRRLARLMLAERVPPPLPFAARPGLFGWLGSALRDPVGWRARAYLLVKFPLAVLTVYVVAICWGGGLFWLTYPIWWQTSGPGPARANVFLDVAALIFRGGAYSGPRLEHNVTIHFRESVYADTWPRAVLVQLAGLVLLLAAPWVVRGLVGVDRWLIRGLLGRTRGSERVRELERARAQVVADSAATLRRIERDLHDGTQAQLATLAMNLGQAKEKLQHRANVPFDPAGALDLIDTAHRHSKEALAELRDIARGIHPPALDVGLDAALVTLVARSAVPAVLHTDIRDRPSRAIETIAYFSAAELLANVAKHSQARCATVEVSARDGALRLQVSDDGVGGAHPGTGSGLPGLNHRVRAVDGHLHISSPPGGPTVVRVDLPYTPDWRPTCAS
jgi:signal transduction histidine kinase